MFCYHVLMSHADLVRLWDEAWSDTTWFAAISASLDGLTPEQAAAKPGANRHSIWQIVHHLTFWHEYVVNKLSDGPRMTKEEIDRRNWLEPGDVSEGAWQAAISRFVDARAKVREVLSDESRDIEQLRYFGPHEIYHLGQIMANRAALGLVHIE